MYQDFFGIYLYFPAIKNIKKIHDLETKMVQNYW